MIDFEINIFGMNLKKLSDKVNINIIKVFIVDVFYINEL